MNTMDRSSPRLPARPELWLASACAASGPARWARSPLGSALAAMACRRPVTSCCVGPGASRLTAASTCSCTARPSRLTPRSLTWRTPATRPRLAPSRSTAPRSAASKGEPRAITTGTGVWSTPWKGAASRAACMLGLLAGRKLASLALATLASDGKKCWASTAAAIQAATTTQRKRTANRPMAAKNLDTRISFVRRKGWRTKSAGPVSPTQSR